MDTKTAMMRNDRERSAREAADLLISVIATLEGASLALEDACSPSLSHRAQTLRTTAERLQADVAVVLGNIVRERVVEEYSQRPDTRKPSLYIA